jgi:hypothetical protein
MKDKLFFFAKFLGFLVTYFIIMIVVDSLIPSNVEVEVNTITIITLIAQIVVNSIAIVYLMLRLRLNGIKLILTTASIVFGIQIFMTQIETWIFIEAFPMFDKNEILKLVIGSLILFFLISTIAFFIFKPKNPDYKTTNNNVIPKSWIWRIPMLAVIYMLLYIGFGIMIAWRSEELRNFYAESIVNISYVELRIIQVFRGFLWILLCVPLIIWFKGKSREKIVAISLLLALLPTILLIFPNPYMPKDVRLTHFVEVFLSNGLFGILLGFVLTVNKIRLWNRM